MTDLQFADDTTVYDYDEVNTPEPEYDGAIDESDYPVEEPGSLPAEILRAKLSTAETQRPLLIKQVKELSDALTTAERSATEQETLLSSWKRELDHWKATLEIRITPAPDDLTKIRACEENVVKYTTAHKDAQAQIVTLQKQLASARQQLASVHALEAVNVDAVLNLNLGDGLAAYPFLIAQIASSAITSFRYSVIGIEDFELNRLYEKHQQLKAQLVEASPIQGQLEEQLDMISEDIARLENKVEFMKNFETAYMLLFSHYYRAVEDPREKQRIFIPKSYSQIRDQLQDKAQKRLEQRLADQKAARKQKAAFTDSVAPNFF
jgi:hypothetical protein